MNFKEIDVCLVTGLYPKEEEETIQFNSIYGIQNAANVFQWNIVNGIIANGVSKLKLINSLYIGSFPKKYTQLLISSYKFKLSDKFEGENIGFINIPIFKEILRFFLMKKELKKWALENHENKLIISYAATYPMTKALEYVKRINSNIQTCLVVPDLPIYMNLSKNKTGLLHQIKNKIVIKQMSKADSYILLTEQMRYKIKNSENKPYVVIEGMASPMKGDLKSFNELGYLSTTLKKKYFLYSGTLNIEYGVLDLIKSFEELNNQDLHLVICGEGEAEEILKKCKNEQIHFLGRCSHEDVLCLQQNAYALINPRKNSNEYTKYSFPSKIMEYLSSGRPTIAYFLDGMPLEYKKYMICIDEEVGLTKVLQDVIEKGETFCECFGKNAKSFVLSEKNSTNQMKKVLDLFDEKKDSENDEKKSFDSII